MALKTKWDSKVFLRIRDLWDTQRRIAVKKLRATEADPGHQKRGRENGVQQGGAEERQHLRKSSQSRAQQLQDYRPDKGKSAQHTPEWTAGVT